MALIRSTREAISQRYRSHGVYSRSLDRLNRLPLLRGFASTFSDVPVFATREAMWDHLAAARPAAIDYLEFGVHAGHSILHWARANHADDSRFVGFDTFTGLPDDWNATFPRGHFDTKGAVPVTSDTRVSFVRGLFQDTLDGFLATYAAGRRPLVVHIDCDLYASALYCLTRLDSLLTPGTLLMFDEFGDVLHEFRAFGDWTSSYRRRVRLVASHDTMFTAAMEVL